MSEHRRAVMTGELRRRAGLRAGDSRKLIDSEQKKEGLEAMKPVNPQHVVIGATAPHRGRKRALTPASHHSKVAATGRSTRLVSRLAARREREEREERAFGVINLHSGLGQRGSGPAPSLG
ncbi:hypothetical protein WME89_21215 [Sorangium sp. So ce321]|uniref:hypothetical protein n=1 Tax=Sorangium sp. So ce321 TaxID=3133300 RepID=UPI003F630553